MSTSFKSKNNATNYFYWKFRSRRKRNIFVFIFEEVNETILDFFTKSFTRIGIYSIRWTLLGKRSGTLLKIGFPLMKSALYM